MDPARHEQVVEAFFKCHPQAISDIFRVFLLATNLPGNLARRVSQTPTLPERRCSFIAWVWGNRRV
jgi:hypothetical protein